MKLKCIFTILLSVALILSTAGSVAAVQTAADVTNTINPSSGNYFTVPHSATTEVIYSVGTERYVITIPGQINFQNDVAWNAQLAASDVTLASGRVLNVTVASTHGYLLVQHTTAGEGIDTKNISYQMDYTLMDGSAGVADKTTPGTTPISLLKLPVGTTEGTVPLKFTMTDVAPELGTYKDVLTFTAMVEGAIPASV